MNEIIKEKKLAVLKAQQALATAQADLALYQIQTQIDAVNAADK